MIDDQPTREQLASENARLAEELERVKRQAAALLSAGSGEEQERMLERYREYRHFFDKGAPIHVVIAADGSLEDVNESFTRCMGYSKEEALGMSVLDLVIEQDRAPAMAVLESEFSGRPSGLLNMRCKAKDGSLRKIRSSGDEPAAAVYRDGNPVRIYATFIDVTDATDVMPPGFTAAPAADRLGALTALDWIAVVVVGLFGLGLALAPFTISASFTSMYRNFAATLPGVTVLVMSAWYALLCALAVLGPLVFALIGRRGLALRRGTIAGAFVFGVAATVFYVFGLYAPIFTLAGRISE